MMFYFEKPDYLCYILTNVDAIKKKTTIFDANLNILFLSATLLDWAVKICLDIKQGWWFRKGWGPLL